MENPQQILIETQFEGLTLYVRPHETHEWLMETKLVAEGYGVDESNIKYHLKKHNEELVENKHYIRVRNPHSNPRMGIAHVQLFWTKRGVIRLGFFIKSERAKLFRDWAEDLIIRELEKKNDIGWVEAITQLEARVHTYIGALHQMMKKENQAIRAEVRKNHSELKELIHNLTLRVDNLEQYLYQPKQLPEVKTYTYLIRKKNTNEYKIGKSIEPIERIKNFKTAGTDAELITALVLPNKQLALTWERTLQNTFEHLCLQGEWFTLSPQEVAFIQNIAEAFEEMYQTK